MKIERGKLAKSKQVGSKIKLSVQFSEALKKALNTPLPKKEKKDKKKH